MKILSCSIETLIDTTSVLRHQRRRAGSGFGAEAAVLFDSHLLGKVEQLQSFPAGYKPSRCNISPGTCANHIWIAP